LARRIPSVFPTRSRAIVHNEIVTTVAVSDEKSQDLYKQASDALAVIERNLAQVRRLRIFGQRDKLKANRSKGA
jgi:hypothetical protein